MCKPRRLPVDLETLLPQKRPMRMVDTLADVGQGWANLTATVSEDMPFVAAGGRLDDAAFLEMMAQGIAALNAFEGGDDPGTLHEGFLSGVRSLEFKKRGLVGDILRIHVKRYATLGEFSVVEAEITRGDELLARGMVTVWAGET